MPEVIRPERVGGRREEERVCEVERREEEWRVCEAVRRKGRRGCGVERREEWPVATIVPKSWV